MTAELRAINARFIHNFITNDVPGHDAGEQPRVVHPDQRVRPLRVAHPVEQTAHRLERQPVGAARRDRRLLLPVDVLVEVPQRIVVREVRHESPRPPGFFDR